MSPIVDGESHFRLLFRIEKILGPQLIVSIVVTAANTADIVIMAMANMPPPVPKR